jgi:hypothetical protein
MFDYLKGVGAIDIAYEDMTNLITRVTNNPLAESELPEMLREAVRRGIRVRVIGPAGFGTYQLSLEGDKFNLQPIAPTESLGAD